MLTITIYRLLLRLYPSSYHDEYGEEMMAVFSEMHAEIENKSSLVLAVSCAREAGGLLRGALHEHVRNISSLKDESMFSSRRPAMRSEFRFPKATVTLMAILLV